MMRILQSSTDIAWTFSLVCGGALKLPFEYWQVNIDSSRKLLSISQPSLQLTGPTWLLTQNSIVYHWWCSLRSSAQVKHHIPNLLNKYPQDEVLIIIPGSWKGILLVLLSSKKSRCWSRSKCTQGENFLPTLSLSCQSPSVPLATPTVSLLRLPFHRVYVGSQGCLELVSSTNLRVAHWP